jgi:hypothetical protein
LRRNIFRLGPHHRTRIAIAVVAVTMLHTPPALAYSAGITGLSGEQGSSCNVCHSGGVTPTVHFEGPTQLGPDTTGTFRFVVQGNVAAEQHPIEAKKLRTKNLSA